jgi:hypothetical protein
VGFPFAALTQTGALPSGLTFTDNHNGTATLSGTPAGGTGGAYNLTIGAANGIGSAASQAFALTVHQAPIITGGSHTFTVGTADSATITTSGFGAAALTESGALPGGLAFHDNGNGTASVSGTATAGTGGTYVLSITANNGVGSPDVEPYTITVNEAPSFTSAGTATFTTGIAGSLAVAAIGFPFPSLSVVGTLPAGVTFTDNGNGTASLAGTPSAATGGVYHLTLQGSNGVGSAASQTFTLTVKQGPAITSPANETFTANSAGLFFVTTTGFPTPALSLTGTLPAGVTFNDRGNGTGRLIGTPASGTGGIYNLTITAANSAGSTQQSFVFTIHELPSISSANQVAFILGQFNSFTVTTLGFPAPALTETGSLPSGVTCLDNHDGTATISGTPAVGTQGSYNLSLDASNHVDSDGTQSFTLLVGSQPAITSAPSRSFALGQFGTFTFSTTGFPSATLGESGALPGGLTFHDNGDGTATLSGTPTAGSARDYTLSIDAGNNVGNDAVQSFALRVTQVPAITTSSTSTFEAGQSESFTIGTSGFPIAALTETGLLPAGITFTDNLNGTATFSGTPSAATGGTYNLTLGADNGITPAASQSFTLTVDQAPVITSPASRTFTVGTNGTFTIHATGFPIGVLSEAGALPTGVTFVDNLDGTATLSGTPAAATGGTYHLTLGASNGVLPAATQSFTLAINQAPAVTSAAAATFIAGQSGSYTMTTTGFPIGVMHKTGTLPAGVTFTDNNDGTATIAGTPAAGTGGSYSLTLTASNGVSPNGTLAFTLTVDAAPVIVTSPTSTTINAGGNASFTSSATGYPAPAVQWQVSTNGGTTFTSITNGGVYSGATTDTLSITAATASMDKYEYQALCTNTLFGAGSPTTTTTAPATLTVDNAPAISINPSNSTVNANGNTSFSAAATGDPTPSVQWQLSTNGGANFNNITNGGVYSGATTNTLTITGATAPMNTYEYQAVYSNTLLGAGSPSTATSTPATLSVDYAPGISTNPTNSTVNAGGNASFTSSATGNPTPTVQWQVSTNGGATFNNITNGGVYSGAASNTLHITAAPAAMNSDEYRAVYSNTLFGAGSASTAATTAATLTVDFGPTVTGNPVNQTVNTGSNATFTVAANGNPAPTVQWQISTNGGTTFNNLTSTGIYSGVTTHTLTLTAATLAENGHEYRAVLSNTLLDAGSPSTATTTAATLTVDAAPVVGINPTGVNINAGDNTSFTSSATGNPAPTEQWQLSSDGGSTFTNITDGGVYSGSTTQTLSITGSTADMNGDEYRDVFTNGTGTADTNPSTLSVDFAPMVTANPTNDTVDAGGTASFTAAAAGNPAPAVQWQVSTDGGGTFNDLANTGIYSGVTTQTLDLTGTSLTENGCQYRAVFSNALLGAGSPSTAATTPATLTVGTPVITVSAYAQLVSSTSNTGTLHVQGEQDGTDANLIYTWSIISQPSAVASEPDGGVGAGGSAPLAMFAINGTNSAKNTPVTFLASGDYILQVVASNGIQSATSQVQVTASVKASAAHAATQTTQVSGVQTAGSAKSITGFVVTFNGPLDPTTAQDVRGYRILRQSSAGGKLHFLQWLFGANSGSQTDTSAYKIASAVYDPQTDSVTLTLAAPMPVKNGVRLVEVMGKGLHAVLDANGKPIDGDANAKAGGNFTYRLGMSVAKSVSYQTADGDRVKLSLSGPGEIVSMLPAGNTSPVIFLSGTDPATSVLTGKLRRGRKGLGYAVIDQISDASQASIQLGGEFHVNSYVQ